MGQINDIDTYFKSSLKNIELEPSPELMNRMAASLGVKKGYDWKSLSLNFICIVAVLVCIYDFNYIIKDNRYSITAEVPVATTLFISAPPEPVFYKAPDPVVKHTIVSKRSKKAFSKRCIKKKFRKTRQ